MEGSPIESPKLGDDNQGLYRRIIGASALSNLRVRINSLALHILATSIESCEAINQRHQSLHSLSRFATHLAVFLLAAAVILAGRIDIPEAKSAVPTTEPVQPTRIVPTSRGGPRLLDEGFLIKDPVPRTTIPERPREDIIERPREGIITYIVQPGDTVCGIAERFEISSETILWANDELEDTPDLLAIGQQLIILPVSGVYHTVEEGDTLVGIAEEYKVDVEAIIQCEYNELEEPYEIKVGQKLIVPGGKEPYIPRVVHAYSGPIPEGAARGTGSFGWPVSGIITQGYWDGHRAIDIGAPEGTLVYAADSGYVVYAGWRGGYGQMLLINHGNGFETLYAHFSDYYVDAGQSVKKGELIGRVGITGRTTGPHLHFEIRKDGSSRNPFGYLP